MKRSFFCFLILVVSLPAFSTYHGSGDPSWKDRVAAFRKADILREAAWAMGQKPVTITSYLCPRSAGGKHDFYSEGDYWWPDPKHPGGPYIQRDGETNPENFVAHRHAMIRFSTIVGDLAAAYVITHDRKYVTAALVHIDAWFRDTATMMNPNLQYAQAIHGITLGRGIGIIDTIHLMEVARAIYLFEQAGLIPPGNLKAIKSWFARYIDWLMTSKNGHDEMNAKNNHGTCWVMQVASFAQVTGDKKVLDFCRDRYKEVLLPHQMAENGSFPRELARTKPYGYSLFNLDAMTTICQILSDPEHDLWKDSIPGGKTIRAGIGFMFPYVAHKDTWPKPPDVMFWKYWPVAQPFLVFGAVAFNDQAWYQCWEKLNHDPKEDEIIRNLPIRHPLIWLN